MPNDLSVTPQELTKMAGATLSSAILLSGFGPSWESAVPADRAFGNLPAAVSAREESESSARAAEEAVAVMASVLESDVEALYQTAFNYGAADDDNRSAIRKIRDWLPG